MTSEKVRASVEAHELPSAIRAAGGIVVRVMGDGLLALFGAPAAHEDDAIRATNAGLDMVADVAAARATLLRETGEELPGTLAALAGLLMGHGDARTLRLAVQDHQERQNGHDPVGH